MRQVPFIAGGTVWRLFMHIDEEDGSDIAVFKNNHRPELQETPVTRAAAWE